MPVETLRPNPKIPHGSSRCNAENEMFFAIPNIRRLTINATPRIIESPMKCKVSSVGHAQLVALMKSAIDVTRIHSLSAGSAPGTVISGCRISPPIFAALVIRPNVMRERTSTAIQFPFVARDVRRNCHSPSHAIMPVISMKARASRAASWCLSMRTSETPG